MADVVLRQCSPINLNMRKHRRGTNPKNGRNLSMYQRNQIPARKLRGTWIRRSSNKASKQHMSSRCTFRE